MSAEYKISEFPQGHSIYGLCIPVESLVDCLPYVKGFPLINENSVKSFNERMKGFSEFIGNAIIAEEQLSINNFCLSTNQFDALFASQTLLEAFTQKERIDYLKKVKKGLEAINGGKTAEPEDIRAIDSIIFELKLLLEFGRSDLLREEPVTLLDPLFL